jgi:hypothetical protein
VQTPVQLGHHAVGTIAVFDRGRAVEGTISQLPPSPEGITVGVAIKRLGELDAFAFGNESYVSPTNLFLDNWRLHGERFGVRVDVASGALSTSANFVIENAGDNFEGFRLIEAP